MKLKQLIFSSMPLLCLVSVLTFAGWSLASDIALEVSLDRRRVSLTETLQLTVTVRGQRPSAPLTLPDIEGFRSQYLGPTTSVSIVNRVYSSAVSYRYLLFPEKVGTYQIPSLSMQLQGQTYQSEPIKVEVLPTASSPPATEDSSQAMLEHTIQDRVFLTMEADHDDVYFNETMTFRIKLFSHQVPLSDIHFPQLTMNGFLTEELSAPSRYRQLKDGIYYDVIEFSLTAYPVREGRLIAGPASLDASILYERPRERRSLFEDFGFFQGGFFDDFFGRREKYPMTLESKPLTINVRPLPPSVPDDFSLGVGQFDLSVSVSPQDVSVGDPITVRMILSGKGNLRNTRIPYFQTDDVLRVYDPQIRQDDDKKILEQVLIPRSEDLKRIPEVRFVYFDPKKRNYQTIVHGPFDIQVNPHAGQQSLRVIASDAQPLSRIDEVIGEDIVFIKDNLGPLVRQGQNLYQSLIFWIVLGGYTFGLVFFFIFYSRREKEKRDPIYAKRIKAPTKARRGLKKIYALTGQGQVRQFYDEVFLFLKEYLNHKFFISEGRVTAHEVQDHLHHKGVDRTLCENVKEIFSRCESIRYGALKADETSIKQDYQALKEIIEQLERIY